MGINQYVDETEEEYNERAKQRLKEKFTINEENGCWEWDNALMGSGYGYIFYKGRNIGAHRLSIKLLTNKNLESDDLVLHKCHNRKCVNPEHLYIGTQEENIADAKKEGNFKNTLGDQSGENNLNSKLTKNQVREIRELYDNTELTQEEIADKFNTNQTRVSKIVRYDQWKHID